MTRRIITLVLGALAALTMVAGPAAAAPSGADGTCVAKGVQALDGPTKASVARSSQPLPLNAVILDHVFNGADVTEGALGMTICD